MTRRVVPIVACLLALHPAPATARQVDIGLDAGVYATSSRNVQLGNLFGAGVTLRRGSPRGRELWVNVQSARSTGRRFGIPCGGFVIQPCPPEPLLDSASARSAALGGSFTVVRRDHIDGALLVGFRLASLKSMTRGQSSGDSLQARTVVGGADLGVELRVRPKRQWPLAIVIAGTASPMMNPASSMDSYEPFQGVALTTLSVALRWHALRRSTSAP